MALSVFKSGTPEQKRERLKSLGLSNEIALLVLIANAWEEHWLIPTTESKRRSHLERLGTIEEHCCLINKRLRSMIDRQRDLRNPAKLTAQQRGEAIEMIRALREEIDKLTKPKSKVIEKFREMARAKNIAESNGSSSV